MDAMKGGQSEVVATRTADDEVERLFRRGDALFPGTSPPDSMDLLNANPDAANDDMLGKLIDETLWADKEVEESIPPTPTMDGEMEAGNDPPTPTRERRVIFNAATPFQEGKRGDASVDSSATGDPAAAEEATNAAPNKGPADNSKSPTSKQISIDNLNRQMANAQAELLLLNLPNPTQAPYTRERWVQICLRLHLMRREPSGRGFLSESDLDWLAADFGRQQLGNSLSAEKTS